MAYAKRAEPRVLVVSVGSPREFDFNGRPARSAIWKAPVQGRVAARGVNLEGDDQSDREAHGGPDKAVYAYASEDYRHWESLGRAFEPGAVGENLTTAGVDLTGARIGDRWRVGSVLLEVSEPRVPCWKLGVRVGDPAFPRLFTEVGRPGAYLRIVEEGALGAGDAIEVVSRASHDVTIGDVFRIYTRDRHEAGRLVEVEELSDAWKGWARTVMEKAP